MRTEVREDKINRKNLISSLITGLLVGAIIGSPLGWFAHRFFAEQRIAQILICRQKNSDKPENVVQSLCGSWF